LAIETLAEKTTDDKLRQEYISLLDRAPVLPKKEIATHT